MKITFTRPKEDRRQKNGKKLRIFYRANAKVPFEAFVELTKQDMNSSVAQELTKSAMNEAFKMVSEKLTEYMGGFDSFSKKLYEKGK